MKALLISLFFLLSISFNINAQFCDGNTCVEDVTSEVYSNMQCSGGTWTPDIDICWGTRPYTGGYYCVIQITNNSTTITLDVDVYVASEDQHYYQTINPGTCKPIFLLTIIDETVDIEFSSPNHSITCDSEFEMNCT